MENYLPTIDRAIRNLAKTYAFGYYDFDDMMQEGRIEALEVIPRFDESRGCSLEQFIRIHVRNRFINLRRDKMERREPPCSLCEKFEDCEAVDLCPKWNAWNDRNVAKKTLVECFDNEDIRTEETHADFFDGCESLIDQEIVQLVENKFPLALKADYRRYLEGVRLPKHRRLRIEEEIRRIVREEYGG